MRGARSGAPVPVPGVRHRVPALHPTFISKDNELLRRNRPRHSKTSKKFGNERQKILTSSGGNDNYYLKLHCLRTWTIRTERSLRQHGSVLAMFLKLNSRFPAHSSTATPTSYRTLYIDGQQSLWDVGFYPSARTLEGVASEGCHLQADTGCKQSSCRSHIV